MKKLWATLAVALMVAAGQAAEPYVFPAPERRPGQESVLGLRAEPIKNIRVAFIGVGNRGAAALWRFARFPENVTIKVACDLYPEKLEKVKAMLTAENYPYQVDYYTGRDDWKTICERDDIDLVYVTTGAGLHTPIAVHAMKNGKHAAIEVPGARSIADCWKLVDTAEQTRKHCFMLENCNFDDYALAVLNMTRQGRFGEVVHVEGGYLHDMRDYRFNFADEGNWRRTMGAEKPVGGVNPYPTHGIGPVAHWLDIHRGDRLTTLNSVSGADFSLRDAAAVRLGADDALTKRFFLPDMNLSILRTARGKTVLLYYTTSLPGPYSRGYQLFGTRGYTAAYPQNIFAFDPKPHELLSPAASKELIAQYRHPIFKQFQTLARKFGGHGGMDTVMDLRLIYCLNNGLPLDIDVYDAAEWSAVVEASRQSVALGGAPVAIPDFTRGDWEKLKGVKYHLLPPGAPGAVELALKQDAKQLYAPVAERELKLADPKGDAGPKGLVDFVAGAVRVRDDVLGLYYTAAAPIDRSKLSYHLKVMVGVGVEGGYDNAGTWFLVESGKLYRYVGNKPFEWKWQFLAPVPVRIQQQWCEMDVPLKLIAPAPDRIAVRFRCQDDYMPNQDLPAAVLTPGNLARPAAVTASPAADGGRTAVLHDGQVSPDIPGADGVWNSREDGEDQFVDFALAQGQRLRRVIVYWGEPSRQLFIQYPDGQGWKTVATVTPGAGDGRSVVDLPAELPATGRVRLLRPAGQGPAGRPQLLSLREVEIY